jgi:hypothetical protein
MVFLVFYGQINRCKTDLFHEKTLDRQDFVHQKLRGEKIHENQKVQFFHPHEMNTLENRFPQVKFQKFHLVF